MKIEHQKIAEVTLNILEKKTWNSFSFKDVNTKLKFKISSKGFNSKKDLLKNINKYFDYKLSIMAKKIDNSTSKDMIFELFMMRFDLLQNFRKSIMSIFNSFKQKPKNFIFLLPSFLDSMILIANTSNLSIKGLKGNLKLKGLMIIYFSTFLIWYNDDTQSLDKTMTSLDNYLNQAEKLMKFVK